MRKYKYLGNHFYLFGETDLGFAEMYASTDDSLSNPYHTDETESAINLQFSLGVSYALNRNWQLEVAFPDVLSAEYYHDGINYVYPPQGISGLPSTQHDTDNGFNFTSSLASSFYVEFGLRYMIGGK